MVTWVRTYDGSGVLDCRPCQQPENLKEVYIVINYQDIIVIKYSVIWVPISMDLEY